MGPPHPYIPGALVGDYYADGRIGATFLGGLQHLSKDQYDANAATRVRYQWSGATVHITDITVDGQIRSGGIALLPKCAR